MPGSFERLSEAECELVEDFLEKSTGVDEGATEDSFVMGDEVSLASVDEAYHRLMILISNNFDRIALRTMTLDRLEGVIQSKADSIDHPSEEMPTDPTVTRENLNIMLIRDEVIIYFLIAGAMIEQFTIELVLEEVAAEDRQSENHRSRVEQMSEREREDLLHMAGILDDGEKGKVRRAYKIRNDLAHSHDPAIITEMGNVESNIDRTREALDTLHEKIHGIPLDYRLANEIFDGERE